MRTFAIAALSLTLAACGGKPKAGTTPAPEATAVPTEASDDASADDSDGKTKQAPDEASADPCGGGE